MLTAYMCILILFNLMLLLVLQSEMATSRAVNLLKRVARPSNACAKKLAEMFPASKSVPFKRPDNVFDPLADCVALPAQKKKKGTKVKPITVKVIVVPKHASSALPKGQRRKKMMEEKRVKSIQLKRTMSPREVRNNVTCAFKHLCLTKWEFLELNGGQLVTASNQDPGGEVVDRRGSLYVREKDEESQVRYQHNMNWKKIV